jgi:hypothetical protein
MRRALIALLFSLVAAALLIAGVALAGKLTRDLLRQQHAQTVHFTDIDFNPPPDQDRELFLDELQYDGVADDEINLLEDKLALRLTLAFAQHPRVEKVERVTIGPGKRVQVELRYRVPVLAVAVGSDIIRTIDRHGILLPPSVPADGLLVLRDPPPPPLVKSGNTWADDTMLLAAQTAKYLQPFQDQLHLVTIAIQDHGEIILKTRAGTKVLWGHAPGQESADEPQADQKVDQLRRYCVRHGDLDQPDGKEHDVRKAR